MIFRNKETIMIAEKNLDLRLNRCFEASTRSVLSLFIATIFLAVLAGTAWTLYDLRLIFSQGLHGAFKTILIDMLTVLALVEILRTALAYLSEGRVKVTYIIDTVIVVVLTEAMSFWYREMDWDRLGMVITLVLSLACIRIVAVRFSPRRVLNDL
jgi:uncharacterized membrane protein (DUF373 family)